MWRASAVLLHAAAMRVLLHGQRFAAPRPILARAALDLPALGAFGQSPLGFGAAYFACDASGLPGAALGPAAGALFGFPLGLLIVMSSACAAAAVAFLLGRLFRPRLRRWCASFSSPRSRRADPRLAPTKNNRRQRHGPAKRQRRGSAADAKSPLRLLLMGRVEPPDCHDQEPFKELKIPHLNLKKTQTVGVLYWLHCLRGIAKR